MTMQMVVVPDGTPVLQHIAPVKMLHYCGPRCYEDVVGIKKLTVGRVNLIRYDVKQAMKQTVGMFTLLDSRRP